MYPAYKEGYRKRRNSIVTTIAPTGSLSMICGVSSGVEPNFSKEYSRELDGQTIRMIHPMKDSEFFETTYEVSPEQHINILAEFQKHVENAISKCLSKDTLIQTNKGILPIQELTKIEFSPDDKEQFVKPIENLRVFNKDGKMVDVKSVFFGGRKETKSIRFNNGYIIRWTENHKLMTSNGWKR